eukprot:1955749-Pyramimonas_sp.AAC.1
MCVWPDVPLHASTHLGSKLLAWRSFLDWLMGHSFWATPGLPRRNGRTRPAIEGQRALRGISPG